MKLNVGGQQTRDRFPSGWTCLDVLSGADIQHDLQNGPMPLEGNSVSAIYCSHVLEHLWPRNVLGVLKEFYRVLIPGCPIRIVVPDMEKAITVYTSMDKAQYPKTLWEVMGWWFDPSWDGQSGELCLNHVGGFDKYLLHYLLAEAGFEHVVLSEFGKGSDVYCGCDNPGHIGTSMYMNAVKGV